MAESRRRFRNKKRDEGRPGPSPLTPVTIARRENVCSPVVTSQPKILLKKELDANTGSSSSGSNTELTTSFKTIIINRSEGPAHQRNSCERTTGYSSSVATTTAATTTTPTTTRATTPTPTTAPTPTPTSNTISTASGIPTSASLSSVCPALTTASKEKTNGSTSAAGMQDAQLGPPRMTRPTPLLNANARKLFHKSNTDFTVIGVLGAQSVGKSTLLNLLAAERPSNYDYYQHLFAPDADDCIFPNRHRPKSQQAASSSSGAAAVSVAKNVLRPRTDCLQFFITRERYVLVDSAPMLAGHVTAMDADHLDLHTLSSVMQLLSVCHVLLLVIDDINLEQLRLLHAALRLRPSIPYKSYVRDYLPQVLFVRTRAQRQHFEPIHREHLDRQLELLYASTNLPIYRGRGEARTINTLLLPQLSSNAATAHHPNLAELVRQFRERVHATVRLPMCQPSNEFSEMHWFEMFTDTASKCNAATYHFEQIYAENKLSHLELRSKLPADSNWRNDSY